MSVDKSTILILFPMVLLSFGQIGFSLAQSAISVVVPNDLKSTEGNSVWNIPFDGFLGSMRYQQVFAASQFSTISNGGGLIRAIEFRIDGHCRFGGGQTVPSLQINLSTTSRGSDSLNPVFAKNVGLNDAIVRGPSSLTMGGACFPGKMPQFFDLVIKFDSPFFYNSTVGNLLLDIRNYSGPNDDGSQLALDAHDLIGDSISSIFAFEVNATSAFETRSVGFVTRFEIIPVPNLSIEQKTNALVLSWGAPSAFDLESISDLRSATNWQPITTNINYNSNGFTAFYAVPLDSLAGAQFFRLKSH